VITAVQPRADLPPMAALADKLLKARCRLMTRDPWYGHVAMCMEWLPSDMPWQSDEQSKTMGVRIVSGGVIQCVWYPGFVHSQSLEQLYGVVQHEIEHIVRCHTMRIGSHREHEPWNIACCKPDELIVGGRNTCIAELATGDMVYGSEGREVGVVAPMQRHHRGKMVRLKGRYLLPFSVTPEHPVLASPWRLVTRVVDGVKTTVREYAEPDFVEAGKLTGCKGFYGRPARSGYALVIPKYDPTATYGGTQLGRATDGDGQITPDYELDLAPFILRPGDGSIRTDRLTLDEDMAWAMGMYLAEGSPVSADLTAGLQFTLGAHEEDLAGELCRIFGRYGFEPAVAVDGSRLTVKVSSPILARAFAHWFGRGAARKQLPGFLLHHPYQHVVFALLRGYFAGDGHNGDEAAERSCRNNAGSVSRLLALQLQTLGFTHGVPMGLYKSERPEREIDGKVLPPETIYVLSADCWQAREVFGQPAAARQRNHYFDAGRRVYVPLVEVDEEDYDGEVCNVETTDHTYLVSNAVVHNCDMTINGRKSKPKFGYHEPTTDQIILPLDGQCVWVPEDWDVDQTAETYYDKLVKSVAKCPSCNRPMTGNQQAQAQGQGQKGKQGQGQGQGQGQKSQQGQGSQGGDGDGEHQASCPKCGNTGKVTPGSYQYGGVYGKQIDDHAVWSQTEVSQDEARQLIKDITDQATQKCQGYSPGHLAEALKELGKPVVRWRELLRRYLGNHVGNQRRTYSRRNRRIDTFGMPGISHHAAAKVTVIVDTSGSVGKQELEQFFAEIDMISSRAIVSVLQWDHAFQGYSKYRRGDWKKFVVKGRGGTDMAAPIKWLEDNSLLTDCLVMLTDGYCNWASPRGWYPGIGMINVITSAKGSITESTWGHQVYLKATE